MQRIATVSIAQRRDKDEIIQQLRPVALAVLGCNLVIILISE
jgi:hypothetical protein